MSVAQAPRSASVGRQQSADQRARLVGSGLHLAASLYVEYKASSQEWLGEVPRSQLSM
jgi:hypothetical protein